MDTAYLKDVELKTQVGLNRFGSQFRQTSTASRSLEQIKCAGAERDFR